MVLEIGSLVNATMSEEELQAEWQYRRDERIAILLDGANRPPTAEERADAYAEADLWLADWRRQERLL